MSRGLSIPLLLPLLLVGCAGDAIEYSLDLELITPGNQDPFSGLDRLVLTLEPERGDAESFELSATSGSPQLQNLGEFEDTRIALEGYVGDELVTFGRSVSLTVSNGDARTEPVLVAEVDQFAWLGSLPQGTGMAAAASDGLGNFYLFGGTDQVSIGGAPSSNAVLKINIAPPEDGLTLDQVDALPEFTGQNDGQTHSGRIGHSATYLTDGLYAGKILIAGGSQAFLELQTTTYDAAIFDPATETSEALPGAMASSRTNHLAVVNTQGNVLLFGGWASDEVRGLLPRDNAEVFDLNSGQFERLVVDLPGDGIYGVAADLGTDGTLYCGGAQLGTGVWWSVADCTLIAVSMEDSSVADLPVAVTQAAMAPLGDGRALVTGGLSIAQSENFAIQADSTSAENGAWIYDVVADAWQEAETPMVIGRAYHEAIPLPDGRVLIVGGATDGELLYADSREGGAGSLACAELYTPGEGFSLIDEGCNAGSATGDLPAQTYFPAVASDPNYGIFVAGGIDLALTGVAGAALWTPNPGDR